MDLHPYLTQVAHDLDRATALADEPTREVVGRLVPSVETAVRSALVQALSDAAASLTSELEDAVVTVRMDGRDPVLEVRQVSAPAASGTGAPLATGPGPEADTAGEDGGLARVSLRLPELLKEQAEGRAGAAGQSLNTWIVQALRRAVTDRHADAGPDRTTPYHRTRRVTGWA